MHHGKDHYDMGDNTADLDDLDDLDDYLYSAANDYRYDTSDHIAAAVDDACAAWLRARGIGIHRPYVESDDPPAPVDDRADALDRVYDFAVARARYHNNRTRDNFDRCNAAAVALIAWDDTHTDAAGDEVRKRRVPPPPPPPLFSTRCSE